MHVSILRAGSGLVSSFSCLPFPVSPWLLKRVTHERGRIKPCICIYQKACVMKCSDSLVLLCSACCKERLKANITHTHNQLTNTHTHTHTHTHSGLILTGRSITTGWFRRRHASAILFITSTFTSYGFGVKRILAYYSLCFRVHMIWNLLAYIWYASTPQP